MLMRISYVICYVIHFFSYVIHQKCKFFLCFFFTSYVLRYVLHFFLMLTPQNANLPRSPERGSFFM